MNLRAWLIKHLTPWWDEHAERQRHQEAVELRQHAKKAARHALRIVIDYRRANGILRK